ncbi:MAG TPA: phosphoribosylamine--glycine ligase [Firmicutes bacterium]|nr:phosphoribosylamine--glycine ligase [Bacillota bacterium]
MRVLIIGSGGREHALAWKIKQSPKVEHIYVAPGSDGLRELAEPVAVDGNSMEALADWAEQQRIDLTIVGPEMYLALGITDLFAKRGLPVFGPSKGAAQLEASKVRAKEVMAKYQIPTAGFQVFTDPQAALSYVRSQTGPLVVKADGLAAGKGVTVADNPAEAEKAIKDLMVEKIYGDAGKQVVIEETLYGEEVSLLAVTDGTTILPLLPAQDHKRAFAGDQGPNTGGMGAYAPASLLTPELLTEVRQTILEPTIEGMAKEGHPYSGLLYVGLMITDDGPKVVEFNVRFGDPEAQVILPLLENDLLDICLAVIERRLDQVELKWKEASAACVVLASAGYPGSYEVGQRITGLSEAAKIQDLLVFHAGTKKEKDCWQTAGGRVLNLVGIGRDLPQALAKAYQGAEIIDFPGCQYRKDIGWRELNRQ